MSVKTTNNHVNGDNAIELDGRYSGIDQFIKGHGLKHVVYNVGPPFAERLLAKIHPNQRKPKEDRIRRFAADMAAGRWRLTHQSVGIDEDGFLVDGQNRLRAVLRSRAVVPMVVCYGVPRTGLPVMDTGMPRNVADAATIMGRPLPNVATAGVARAMATGIGRRAATLSTQEILDWVWTYRHGLAFCFKAFGGKFHEKGILTANTRAVLARAYYSADRDRLQKFGDYLVTGMIEAQKTDGAVVMLKTWLDRMNNKSANVRALADRAHRATIYGCTQYALDAFLRSQRITQLLESKEELFPLPDLESFDSAPEEKESA